MDASADHSALAALDPSRRDAWLQLLVDESSDLFLLVDEQGTISYCSAAAERLFHCPAEETLGRNVFDFCHEGERLILARLIRAAARTDLPYAAGQVRFRAAGGEDRFMTTAKSVPHTLEVHVRDAREALGGLLLSLHDISERIAMEDSMTRIHALGGMGRLAGGIAHDFNNMLQVINSYADLLAESPDLSEDDLQAVTEIQRAGARGSQLTSKLLAFGQRQMSTPVLLDLNELLRDSEQELRAQAKGLDFELILSDDPCRLKIDREQLRQILSILVDNAVDAADREQGGRLEIATALLDDLEIITLSVEDDQSYVALRVQDDGRGMDDTTLSHLFEPFFTTKEVGQGTGLGLATVHGIVKQNKGFITVSTDPGQGATFLIYLPEAADELEPRRAASIPVSTADANAVSVLLVEDEDTVRGIVKQLLVRDGYRVTAAADVAEAERCLAEGVPDILLTDISLPDGNGVDLALRCREQRQDLPVLLMSGYPIDALQQSDFSENTSFLQKPFPNHALQSSIAELMATRAG